MISNNMLEKYQPTGIQLLHNEKDLCDHLEGEREIFTFSLLQTFAFSTSLIDSKKPWYYNPVIEEIFGHNRLRS